MKVSKKLICFILALALMLLCVTPALAADDPGKTIYVQTGNSGTRIVSLDGYAVTVDILWVKNSREITADLHQFTTPATLHAQMWCSSTMQKPNGSIVSNGSDTGWICDRLYLDGVTFATKGGYVCQAHFAGWYTLLARTYYLDKTETKSL